MPPKLRFSFRSDKYEIPDPIDLFEFVRAIICSFERMPYRTYLDLSSNIVPMGQLVNGIYFSFKEDPTKVLARYKQADKDDSLKLEMTWVVPGLVRIEVTNKGLKTHVMLQ